MDTALAAWTVDRPALDTRAATTAVGSGDAAAAYLFAADPGGGPPARRAGTASWEIVPGLGPRAQVTADGIRGDLTVYARSDGRGGLVLVASADDTTLAITRPAIRRDLDAAAVALLGNAIIADAGTFWFEFSTRPEHILLNAALFDAPGWLTLVLHGADGGEALLALRLDETIVAVLRPMVAGAP